MKWKYQDDLCGCGQVKTEECHVSGNKQQDTKTQKSIFIILVV